MLEIEQEMQSMKHEKNWIFQTFFMHQREPKGIGKVD